MGGRWELGKERMEGGLELGKERMEGGWELGKERMGEMRVGEGKDGGRITDGEGKDGGRMRDGEEKDGGIWDGGKKGLKRKKWSKIKSLNKKLRRMGEEENEEQWRGGGGRKVEGHVKRIAACFRKVANVSQSFQPEKYFGEIRESYVKEGMCFFGLALRILDKLKSSSSFYNTTL
jgi:hypothetical protein